MPRALPALGWGAVVEVSLQWFCGSLSRSSFGIVIFVVVQKHFIELQPSNYYSTPNQAVGFLFAA